MSHDTHTLDSSNKDLKVYSRADYMNLTSQWADPFGLPTVYGYTLADGRTINVVRDDLIGVGSKARFADLFMQSVKSDTLVYVAPKVGFAGMSLAYLARKHGKKVILFAPACVDASKHQRMAYQMGAELIFFRIAAMPNLNKVAQEYAKTNGYTFVPFGLAHYLVTACIVRVADNLTQVYGQPKEVWTVISTGVLSRGLQIGWPEAEFKNVAVARNIKDGERGRAELYSHPLPFVKDTKKVPPFPSVLSYDAKAWEYIERHASDGAWMWSVAAEIEEPQVRIPSHVSAAPWKVLDFDKHSTRSLTPVYKS